MAGHEAFRQRISRIVECDAWENPKKSPQNINELPAESKSYYYTKKLTK